MTLNETAVFAIVPHSFNGIALGRKLASEYSRLSSLPAPADVSLAKRPSGAGSDERRLYSQARRKLTENKKEKSEMG